MVPLRPWGVVDRTARRWQATAIGFGGVAAACSIAFLLILADVIDRVFLHDADLSDLAGRFVALALVLVVRAVCQAGAEVSGQRASGRIRATVRRRLMAQLFALGPAGVRAERTGELAATTGPAVDALDPYVTAFLPARVLAGIVPIMVLVTILVIDPWTTVILLFAGPMLLLLLAVIGGRTRALTQRRFDELGWLQAFYLDMIRGLSTLKAFGRSADGADTIEAVSTRHATTTMEVLRTAFQTSLVMEWAATAATALVAVQVSFRLVEDDLRFGPALAVLVLTPEFFLPWRRLALEYHAGQSGTAAMERITAVLELPATSPVPSADVGTVGAATPPGAAGAVIVQGVELEGVGFTYPGSEHPALQGVDLMIAPGETVALVGPSGAGKSTLARLVLRFVEPDVGVIRVDGAELDGIHPDTWRRSVAWVPQDPTIFAGTVADNIRLAEPDASMERVRAAAAAARADGFIEQLPERYETRLGEGGLRLSGGQRQRLAIARAALRDAPLVVLDEFTAHLDPDTEAEVLAAMGDLLADRTALVIAHRPATIAAADRVVHLDAGRIVAEVTP